tara:strand:- start:1297 stop:1587 length:291 start_codon:yes stop_codon:yes gene_type:complete
MVNPHSESRRILINNICHALNNEQRKIDRYIDEIRGYKNDTNLFDALRIVLDIHETDVTIKLRKENEKLKKEVLDLLVKLRNEKAKFADYVFYSEE